MQHTSGHSVERHLVADKAHIRPLLHSSRKENQAFIHQSRVSNLKKVFGDDSESLRMVADVLEVGVLVQHCVVRVQEEVKGVLVKEVHLKGEHMFLMLTVPHTCR